MTNLLLSVMVIGISASFYPFEMVGALLLLRSAHPARNLVIFFLMYNVPLFIISYLVFRLFGSLNFLNNDVIRPYLDYVLAIACLLAALYIYKQRNHPKKSHKEKAVSLDKYEENPWIVGGLILVLNPPVIAFILAGLNEIYAAGVTSMERIVAMIVLMVFANFTTIVVVTAYALKPKLADLWMDRTKKFFTHHSWQIGTIILALFGAYFAVRGYLG
jgi:hypothetical protein